MANHLRVLAVMLQISSQKGFKRTHAGSYCLLHGLLQRSAVLPTTFKVQVGGRGARVASVKTLQNLAQRNQLPTGTPNNGVSSPCMPDSINAQTFVIKTQNREGLMNVHPSRLGVAAQYKTWSLVHAAGNQIENE